MKERPKLLNTEMVKAVLNGRKTQTRIPIPSRFYGVEDTDKHDHSYFYVPDKYGDYHHITDFAGFPQVGDLLYVRETFAPFIRGLGDGYVPLIKFKSDSAEINVFEDGLTKWEKLEKLGYHWRPSIHMPKIFARLWLKVKGVWVERIQDITEGGAVSEGVEPNTMDGEQIPGEYFKYPVERYEDGFPAFSAIESFQTLWDSIYGETHNKWDNNRHVIACEFEIIEKPISTPE